MTAIAPAQPNPNTVAQLAHFFAGEGLVLTLVLFAPFGVALAAVAVLAAGKESIESLGWASWEGKQPWLSSLEDFLFFVLGEVTAYAALLLHARYPRL